jgi:hypothetical protein
MGLAREKVRSTLFEGTICCIIFQQQDLNIFLVGDYSVILLI